MFLTYTGSVLIVQARTSMYKHVQARTSIFKNVDTSKYKHVRALTCIYKHVPESRYKHVHEPHSMTVKLSRFYPDFI